MSGLKEFLSKNGIRTKSHGDGVHIGIALTEAAATGMEIAHVGGHGVGVLGGGALAGYAGLAASVGGPIIGLVGVGMALGSGYAEARELVENENVASGFSQGFVTGLLGWSGKQVADHFGRGNVIKINSFDERTDAIRVEAYNKGLKTGFVLASSLIDSQKKQFLKEIKTASNAIAPRSWNGDENKNARIGYVIELSSGGLGKHYMQ
ncbi:hypothetical protein [Methylobacterium symbioticum]|uniref:hypothetical protein n=1 Tax=Methylobacterium symbioticum TaxID=2584084 RepID=UPI00115BB5C3|nr:hypothetical protein [Methylobacterium symbioticum]